ncbi:MAG: SpoIID/LytB domain-containing protein [Candidatus Deferrimicrobiaceae bacterium]
MTVGGIRGAGLAALLLVFTTGAILFAACASPGPARRGEPPPAPSLPGIPPTPPVPGPSIPAPPPAPRPEAAGARPVRVRLEGIPPTLRIAGDSMRVWNPAGLLLATENGSVTLSAVGNRIAWGGTKMLDSPIDVWSPGGLSIAGRRLPGRIRISARSGGIRVVAVVPLEEYVAAVLSREAAPSFLPEALSALAVSVRTYTLSAIAAPRDPDYDVVAGVEDQVFEGVENVGPAFRAAVEATRGYVLYDSRDRLARTVYHSTCGGMTESAKDAWGEDLPYLRSVTCDDCRESPAWRWEYRMGRAEGVRVAAALGVRAGDEIGIAVAGRTRTGRASKVRLTSGGVAREAKASVFRRAAGYALVKSLWMEIVPAGRGWRLTGKGYGHGVGMCQWGANGMAKRGAGYREILARYYPRTRIASPPGGPGPLAGGKP